MMPNLGVNMLGPYSAKATLSARAKQEIFGKRANRLRIMRAIIKARYGNGIAKINDEYTLYTAQALRDKNKSV